MSRKVNIFNASCQDADVLAFMSAAGINDSTILNALCVLVTSLKANGVWAKCNAIYPFVGGTATTHKFNLKNPADTNAAFRLSFSGGWTHSSTGALPNGTNAFADTFYLPTLLNSSHISFYSRTNSDGLFNDIGSGNGGLVPNSIIISRLGNIFYGHINQNLSTGVANTDSRGAFLVSREGATTIKLYKNALKVLDTNTVSDSISTATVYIGAFHQGATTSRYSNRQAAFATMGTGLTEAESIALNTNIITFQTALSRNV